ncbi:hypothetical protein U8M14_10535 [Virgibacillus pantothenticus]|nr:hypothetical protein [Virgibacillus pantothenticus]MEB5469190.1 hypothetical protein [Virgibacillus pantothenticus]
MTLKHFSLTAVRSDLNGPFLIFIHRVGKQKDDEVNYLSQLYLNITLLVEDDFSLHEPIVLR